jgi:septal ring factor EnvC (AmiA/AmiB activator)
MENEKTYVSDKVVDELIERKVSGYYGESKNFTIPHELTVTITLQEYRDLVKSNAIKEHEIDKIRDEKNKLNEKLESYKTENDLLTRKIMRMEQPDLHVDDKAEEA